ncbi:acyltransferase [candidate division TA06 bacterium]|uniref:Acyltransferase n=1 Tax=candidate division TA06 bacterium TaxID=2250710 RepID=A0A523UYS1_UNCT6|nr:MAG: acyltransferase [candidate division TA06 bacterium]
MTIGSIQFRPLFGKKRHNIERAITLMNKKRADLYVLPELFNTGYSFKDKSEVRDLAEPVGRGETTQALMDYAKTKRTSIVAGIAEREGKKIYNTAMLIKPDGRIGKYRKTHLFLFEKLLFDSGKGPYQVHRVGEARVGMLICFDWIFPEPFRELALKGADIIAHPSNLILPYCQDAMVTRALENRIFIILANRVGNEKRRGERLTFTGGSEIISPRGKILAKALEKEETAITAKISLREARDKKVTLLNHIFRDRRTDLYTELKKGRKR